MTDTYYLGVEIGGTKQQICLGYADGTILESTDVRLGQVKAPAILDWIRDTVRRYQARFPIAGIGVGFGGPLELRTGRILCSLQVEGWKDFHLNDWFRDTFGLPCVVANDTFTGGVAELHRGSGIGENTLFYTNIGTGIGGGLFINGRGYDGSGFGAAYLGNTLVPDWRAEEPGAMTRMELICSGRSIAERLSQPGYVPITSALHALGKRLSDEHTERTAQELGQAVSLGDTFACEELDRIARTFSVSLVNMLALSGVSAVVIGGGVAKMGPALFDRIERFTDELAFSANKGRYHIRPSRLMDEAVPTGALILAAGGQEFL